MILRCTRLTIQLTAETTTATDTDHLSKSHPDPNPPHLFPAFRPHPLFPPPSPPPLLISLLELVLPSATAVLTKIVGRNLERAVGRPWPFTPTTPTLASSSSPPSPDLRGLLSRLRSYSTKGRASASFVCVIHTACDWRSRLLLCGETGFLR